VKDKTRQRKDETRWRGIIEHPMKFFPVCNCCLYRPRKLKKM
jgi:hypothetical protein